MPRSDALTERERAVSLWFIRLHLTLETFIPWTLVKRGVKRPVITPLDAPEEFRDEAAAERQRAAGGRGHGVGPDARACLLLAAAVGLR
jgi:hypothetical protein